MQISHKIQRAPTTTLPAIAEVWNLLVYKQNKYDRMEDWFLWCSSAANPPVTFHFGVLFGRKPAMCPFVVEKDGIRW